MHPAAAIVAETTAPFVSLTPDAIDVIARTLVPVRFEAGEALFREGEVARGAVLLSQGLVRVYYLHAGREVNLRLLREPNVALPLVSLITGEPSDEIVEAIEPVVGFRGDFASFDAAAPGVSESLRRVLAEQHYLSMERRLRMLQWKSGAERLRYFRDQMDPEIVARTPGYHVASYLGISPETLSRVKKTLID